MGPSRLAVRPHVFLRPEIILRETCCRFFHTSLAPAWGIFLFTVLLIQVKNIAPLWLSFHFNIDIDLVHLV